MPIIMTIPGKLTTVPYLQQFGILFSTQPEYINSIVVLLPLTVFGILFFNAYFQDGTTTDKETPIWLKNSLRVYRVVLFILAIMLFFKISREISLNINLIICLLLTLLFSLTYAITAFLPEDDEVFWIRRGNIGTALFFVIALFFVNFPYLSRRSDSTFSIEKSLNTQTNMNSTAKTPSSTVLKAYPPAP